VKRKLERDTKKFFAKKKVGAWKIQYSHVTELQKKGPRREAQNAWFSNHLASEGKKPLGLGDPDKRRR